jgi:CRISPR/Cas system-associated protein Cas7 (RAMP superfamily)
MVMMPTEKELLERIRRLEEQNSILQDKLDMIYAILAPDFEQADEEADEEAGASKLSGFIQIDGLGENKKLD